MIRIFTILPVVLLLYWDFLLKSEYEPKYPINQFLQLKFEFFASSGVTFHWRSNFGCILAKLVHYFIDLCLVFLMLLTASRINERDINPAAADSKVFMKLESGYFVWALLLGKKDGSVAIIFILASPVIRNSFIWPFTFSSKMSMDF